MDCRRGWFIVLALAGAGLFGCATATVIPLRGQSPDQLYAEREICQGYAKARQDGYAMLEGAGIGGLVGWGSGAAVGAVSGALSGDAGAWAGYGSAIGALVGVLWGAIRGFWQADQQADADFRTCLREKGYSVGETTTRRCTEPAPVCSH